MAFGDSWLISVMMRFSGNGASYMAGLGAQTEALEGKVDRVTLAMNRLNAATTKFAGGFALAGAAVGAYALTQAAQLQRTLTAIRNETGADPRKMSQIYGSVFSIANQIGVSPNEAARSWLDISRLTAGQLSVPQMLKIALPVEQYASMIHYNRPDVSVDEASKAGLQLVHLFRAYQPDKLIPLLDKTYRLSGLMAESPSQAVRQMSYYEPLFKGLNIDENSSIAMMALLDRAGFRMKVGTNVRAMLLEALGPLQMTSHAQQAHLGYLEAMGIFNRQGKFAWNTPSGGVNFMGLLGSVATWEQAQRKRGVPASDLARILYSTFGKQGGTIAQLMADPQMTAFLVDIRKYLTNPNVGLASGERNRDNTLGFQAGRAWGNLQAVVTELGYAEVPQLTGSFRALGDVLHNAQVWLHQNRGAERAIGSGLAWVTAIAGMRFLIGTLAKFSGVLGFGKALEGLTGGAKAFRVIDTVLTGGLVNKMIRAGNGLRGVAGGVTALDGAGLATAAAGLSTLAGAVGVVSSAVGFWYGLAKNAADATKNPSFGKLLNWSAGGANYGINPYPDQPNNNSTVHITITDKTNGGIRSKVRSSGQILTSPNTPGVLHLAAPGLYP